MKKRFIALILVLALVLPVTSALAVKYYRVNTTWLKAHDKPSFDATVVASYQRDYAVTICRTGKDGWVKVRFRPGGNMVFVQKKYLKLCSSYTAYISQDDTVLLTGPGTNFKSLGRLQKGAKVTVLTHGSAFDFVSSSKGKGYVRNTHLTKNKAAAKPSSAYKARVQNSTGKNVVLRKGPGTKYKAIASYRPGTRVTVLQRGVSWCKVKCNGRTGWIMTRYLKKE